MIAFYFNDINFITLVHIRKEIPLVSTKQATYTYHNNNKITR